MIEVKNLSKKFKKTSVLKDINLEIKEGEVLGFIGPNGAGKSTTMKCLVNLIYPSSGEILVDGYNILKARTKALNNVSALIESPAYYPNLSGLDNIKVFAELLGANEKRINEIKDITGLKDKLNVKLCKYSIGMKQKLSLGIVLLNNPKYLILDEPFSGLDPEAIFRFRNILKDLSKQGHGIIISSHQLLELSKVTDRNIFIKDGKILDNKNFNINSGLVYKITLTNSSDSVLTSFKNLQESDIIKSFKKDSNYFIVELDSTEKIKRLIEFLYENNNEVLSLIPIDSEIENIYKSFYME